MGRFYTLIIVLVFSFNLIIAQENHIDHAIQKGESVYMISRKYGVSMEAIFELNPGSKDVIYAGETLRIPKSSSTTTSTSISNTQITDTQISNYEVKRGETKSGLSRRFGVSIAQLEQQNPHIVKMLQAGHIINVDKSVKEEARIAKQGEHIVVKGETLWGIAQKNGISVGQLTAANSSQLSEFLQIGQTLVIPDKNVEIEIEGQYIVQRGDTKFQLSKRFNMSIAELEAKNPHIVEMLMAGHKLNVDNSVASSTEEIPRSSDPEITFTETEVNTDSDGYQDYIIQAQETLFGLSRKAGMTIDDFTTLNPKLLISVNKGDVIKMPRNVSQTLPSTTITDTSTPKTTEEIAVNKNEALFTNLVTETANGIYFYTPFSSEELSSQEQREKMVGLNADFQRYIDFFQGAQIAIDSAKALKLNFDVTLIKKNIGKSQLEIDSPHKKNVILVPFLDSASNYPNILSNEEVSIIDIGSDITPTEGVKVYKSIPSDEVQKTTTLDYLSEQNAQVVVVSDLDKARNKDLILNIIPDAKFLKVDNAGFFKSNALEKTLNKDKLNYIVLDSEKTIVFLNSTNSLMGKLSEFNIQLVIIDSSLKPQEDTVSDMRYRVLKLIFPTNIDPQNNRGINDFERSYEDVFGNTPSMQAVLGFNVTLDVLLRLSQNSSFENTINTISSEQSHLKFEYKKIDDSSYSNTGIYLMQYKSNEGLLKLK